MGDTRCRLHIQLMPLSTKIPVEDGFGLHHGIQLIPIAEQNLSFVTGIMPWQKFRFPGRSRCQPGTIANEQIRPTHGRIGIGISDAGSHGNPWTLMRGKKVLCPLRIRETMVLSQCHNGGSRLTYSRSVCLSDGLESLDLDHLITGKPVQLIHLLVQQFLRRRHNH